MKPSTPGRGINVRRDVERGVFGEAVGDIFRDRGGEEGRLLRNEDDHIAESWNVEGSNALTSNGQNTWGTRVET